MDTGYSSILVSVIMPTVYNCELYIKEKAINSIFKSDIYEYLGGIIDDCSVLLTLLRTIPIAGIFFEKIPIQDMQIV
jgi:hypothetical protein